jgi:hypothetical protein
VLDESAVKARDALQAKAEALIQERRAAALPGGAKFQSKGRQGKKKKKTNVRTYFI